MLGLFESRWRDDCYRSGAHERLGQKGNGAEDHGFLGDPALLWASPGESGSYHVLGETEFSHEHGIDLKELVLRLQGRFCKPDVLVSRAVQPVEGGET
jgi:hypothetical protein